MKAKLMGVLITMSVMALSLFGVMAYQQFSSIERGQKDVVRTFAGNVIDKIDRNLFERYGDVQAYAFSESARSGNPKRIVSFMSDMMTTYAPVYDLMIVTNTNGTVIAVNQIDKSGKPLDTSSLLGKSFADRPWFQAAIQGKIEPGTAYIEDLHYDADVAKFIGNDGSVMNFTAPIRDKDTGTIVGVWSNRMSWNDVVGQIVKEELDNIKTPALQDVFLTIMDANGQYLIHPEGASHIRKLSHPDFATLASEVEKGTFLRAHTSNENYFKGDTFEAYAKSKGYSIYPGKGWITQAQVSTADPAKAGSWWIVAIACAMLTAGMIVGWWLISWISKSLDGIMFRLNEESTQVRQAASNITQGSQNLASAATEQASALQETASSVEEMNAMVKKSAENATRSRDVSRSSQDAAEKGKETVGEMIQAIEEINTSNAQIMDQVEAGNQQIAEIVKVITEIGNKTKVINDIVFQTKLLSFNASVEAARAGEHGKGFAVVAEEVGNLAQMSGNAAKEIGDMLEDSIKKVESIVSETQSKVSKLIEEGKRKVETGTVVARQCSDILEEVVSNVSNVNGMIAEISTAAQEQSTGINEITKAMNQLDQVTHENASTSQQTAHSAHQLSQQAGSLMEVVQNLKGLVHGSTSGVVVRTVEQPVVRAQPAPQKTEKAMSFKPEISPFGKKESSKGHDPLPGRPLTKVVGADDIPAEDDPRFRDI